MTAKTKTPALPKSAVRGGQPVSMATLRALAAKLVPSCDADPPTPDWHARAALEAMRPDGSDTVLALASRWLEGYAQNLDRRGFPDEARPIRRLRRAVDQAQKHGIIDDGTSPDANADDEEAGYQAARDYFASELHRLAEQYLKARGDDDGLRAGVLLLYADHTPQVLNEAHTSLRYAIEREMETTGRVDPQVVTLLWTVAEALTNGHAMTFDGVGWV